MKQETFNLLLGLWGTLTGTIALLIQFLGYRSDKASLQVAASMCYGGLFALYGKDLKHFVRVKLTNKGRRVVRIHSIALRIHHPAIAAFSFFLLRHGLAKKILQSDIGIYSSVVDPIHKMRELPNSRTYPPTEVVLEENQMIELQLVVADEVLGLLPKRKAWLIVTDHGGIKYKARYFPCNFVKPAIQEVKQPKQAVALPSITEKKG